MSITVELKLIGIPDVTCGPLPQGKLEGPTTVVVSSAEQALTGLNITESGKYKVQVLDAVTKELLTTSDIFTVEYNACEDTKLGNCPLPVVIKPNHNLSQKMRIGQQLMNRRTNRGSLKYMTVPIAQRTVVTQNPLNKFN